MDYKRYAIIVAGGTGSRMGGDIAKQFLMLDDKPVLHHTIETFLNISDIEVVLVLPKNAIDYWIEYSNQHITNPYDIVPGGFTRYHSVKNGIIHLIEKIKDPKQALIAVHDGVRPFVTKELVKKLYIEAEHCGAVIPTLKPTDSVRIIENSENHVVDRDMVRMVQTPQIFSAELLIEAYNQPYSAQFTDDASVLESMGHTISLIEGEATNIKLTLQSDMKIAKAILTTYRMQDNP